MLRTLALAVSCVGVSVALASAPTGAAAEVYFEADEASVNVKTEAKKGVLWWETEGGTITCDTILTGEANGTKFSQLWLTPVYSKCSAFGFSEATIKTEGCVWVMHGKELAAEDEYHAYVDFACPSGKSVKVTAGTCAIELQPRAKMSVVGFANDTAASPDRLEISPTVGGIPYVVTSDGLSCPFKGTGPNSGLLTSSSALIMGAWSKFTGSPVGLRVGSNETAGPIGKFQAGSYPVYVESPVSKEVFDLETEAGKISCSGDWFGQGTALSKDSPNVSLFRVGEQCTAFGGKFALVSGCQYNLHGIQQLAENEFDAYLDLICIENKPMEITGGTCSIEIGTQWALKTLKIVNDSSALPYPDITVTPEVTGMSYLVTQDGLGCPFAGTGMRWDGKISGSGPLTLRAAKTGLSVSG